MLPFRYHGDILGEHMSANDRELLSEYAHRGSEAAFRELVSRYAALVYGTAFRHLQDRGLAEDVSQVAFVRLAQAAPGLEETVNVAGWLYRTARHVSLNMARTRSREARRVQQHANLSSNPPTDEAWRELAGRAVDPALEALDEPEREIVLLRFYRGLKYREVAAEVGISEAAAKMRVARALDRLRGLFQTRGVVFPGAVFGSVLSGLLVGAAPKALAASILRRVQVEGYHASGRVVAKVGSGTAVPAPILSLGLTVCLVSAVVWFGQGSKDSNAPTHSETVSKAVASAAKDTQPRIGAGAGEADIRDHWSPEQWDLWQALTAPLPPVPEMRREAGQWVFGNISSPVPLSAAQLGRQLHFGAVQTALARLAGSTRLALEVFQTALQYADPLILEQTVRALGFLEREAEPLLDEVLALMASGPLSGVPPNVLITALPKMGEPGTVTEKLIGFLKQGDAPSYDAARVSLLLVLQTQDDAAGRYLDSFVRLAREQHPKAQLTGLGMVSFCGGTAEGLARVEAEHPGLKCLFPMVDLIHRMNLLDDEAVTDPDRMTMALNARKALASLELDPATTTGALKEMLQVASNQEDRDWMMAALSVLDPDAAADPMVSNRLAWLQTAVDLRARAQAGSLSVAEAVAALENRETIAEASDALVVMGPQAKACVPTLVSKLGSWRDYFIFKVLRAIEPAVLVDALSLPASAGEAAAALGELGPGAGWALPALRAALADASPESAELIRSALAAIEAPEVSPLAP